MAGETEPKEETKTPKDGEDKGGEDKKDKKDETPKVADAPKTTSKAITIDEKGGTATATKLAIGMAAKHADDIAKEVRAAAGSGDRILMVESPDVALSRAGYVELSDRVASFSALVHEVASRKPSPPEPPQAPERFAAPPAPDGAPQATGGPAAALPLVTPATSLIALGASFLDPLGSSMTIGGRDVDVRTAPVRAAVARAILRGAKAGDKEGEKETENDADKELTLILPWMIDSIDSQIGKGVAGLSTELEKIRLAIADLDGGVAAHSAAIAELDKQVKAAASERNAAVKTGDAKAVDRFVTLINSLSGQRDLRASDPAYLKVTQWIAEATVLLGVVGAFLEAIRTPVDGVSPLARAIVRELIGCGPCAPDCPDDAPKPDAPKLRKTLLLHVDVAATGGDLLGRTSFLGAHVNATGMAQVYYSLTDRCGKVYASGQWAESKSEPLDAESRASQAVTAAATIAVMLAGLVLIVFGIVLLAYVITSLAKGLAA